MDRLLAGLDFVFIYLDDIIIGSRSATKHSRHLRALFQRLQTAGLVINQEKCVFGVVPRRLFFAAQQRLAIILSPNYYQKMQCFTT
jgi:hypothetical protein